MNIKIRRATCIGILLVVVSVVMMQTAMATEIRKTAYVGNQAIHIPLLDHVSTGHTYTTTGINNGMWNWVTMFAVYDDNHLYGGSSYPPWGGTYTTSDVAQSYWQYVKLSAWSPGAWIAEPVLAIVDY